MKLRKYLLKNAPMLATDAYGKTKQGDLATNVPANETDPQFTAWDKSTGISITESQIADLGDYLTDAPTGGTIYARQSGTWVEVAVTETGEFGVTVDGGGSAIIDGSVGFVTIPYDATITNWYLIADVAGDIVFDIKKGVDSIIGAGNKPTLAAQSNSTAVISAWTTSTLSDGDVLEFVVSSASTVTWVNLIVKVNK
jgi:hypothetical protein